MSVTVEKTLSSGGRADLHINLKGSEQTIEVQLSPISDQTWHARDQRYRTDVDHVTWLYGPTAEALAASAVARDGAALLIERDTGVRGQLCLGTRDHRTTRWSHLTECSLQPSGLWTPHLNQAYRLHKQWLSDQQKAKEQVANRRRTAVIRREHGTKTETTGPAQAPPPPTRPRLKSAEPSRSYAFQSALHPEAHDWTPATGWVWLEALPTQHQRAATRLMAYLVQHIYLNGPTTFLEFADIDDPEHHIANALHAARLIDLTAVDNAARWSRRTPSIS